ncbi:uncharacterized protein PAC_14745 [Phialocephala subalpina]|uniref:Uncharacterized protein n=1 Tax=Phialocephala subalpina TaxID=576137 RepID=A0A1L7XIR2_9HELO|nr:uncharacterized protein PAC_14745 [Phialocephala subalpina]
MSSGPSLTECAKRYGTSSHALFNDTGKSGLTPIQFWNTGSKDFKLFTKWKYHEAYQRSTFRSFVTWELEESGLVEEGLDIGDSIEGKWEAQNDVDALPLITGISAHESIPSILMCFRAMLLTTRRHDALIHSQWVALPREQFKDGGRPRSLHAFETRTPKTAMAGDLDVSKFWDKLAGVVRYDIQPAASNAAKVNASGRVNG